MNLPDFPHDPLNLEAIDRMIEANALEEQRQAKGLPPMNFSDDCPPEVKDEFLRNVLSYDEAPLSCQFDRLIENGVQLPPPESIDDQAIHAKLWEIIHVLARFDVYLDRTDHLSDRELYEKLWSDVLREEVPLFPEGSGWRNWIDMLGSGSEEDIELGLKYFDDEESRRHWAEQFPDDIIPPHQDPPYDRDRLLPRPDEPERCDDEEEY